MIIEEHAKRRSPGRPFRAAYAAPTYKLAKPIYREAKDMWGPLVKSKSDTDLEMQMGPAGLPGEVANLGWRVDFVSLEDADNLRGRKYDLIVIDEAADVKEEAYTQVLTPMVADTEGHIVIIGTPKRVGVGFSWFRREYERGLDPTMEDYASMRGPSEGNPFLKESEIAKLRARTPDPLACREEYDAEFLSDLGAVFSRLSGSFTIYPRQLDEWTWIHPEYADGGKIDPLDDFVIGYDIGLHDDKGVITIFRLRDRAQVYLRAFYQQPFEIQFTVLKGLYSKFNEGTIYADINGMGEVPGQIMGREFQTGMVGMKWNNKGKEHCVTNGIRMFEQAAWGLFQVPMQRREFTEFMREKLPSGVWRYTHPPGGHDDTVTAALMCTDALMVPYVARREPKKPVGMFNPETQDYNVDWFLKKMERDERRIPKGWRKARPSI